MLPLQVLPLQVSPHQVLPPLILARLPVPPREFPQWAPDRHDVSCVRPVWARGSVLFALDSPGFMAGEVMAVGVLVIPKLFSLSRALEGIRVR